MSNRQRLKVKKGRCRRPEKAKYANRIFAYAALAELNKKGQSGLSVYRCPAGHYHLGRFIK